MKSITYIVSDINKALAFEWVALHLDKSKFRLRFILLNRNASQLQTFLLEQGIEVDRIPVKSKFHFALAFFRVAILLINKRPDVVHAHLRNANLVGIPTAWILRIGQRIYTRHSSAYNHLYHPGSVKWDKLVSRLSTKVVSISDVVSEVLVNWEKLPESKLVKIPHGFDLDYLYNENPTAAESLKKKYIPLGKGPVIGMVSRYIEWKGVEYGIAAFGMLLRTYPDAFLVLANASGPDAERIIKELAKLPRDTYIEIAFESDIASLYRIFDGFVHIPISRHVEAFGQTYIEALACGIPSVFTLSGIAGEFVQHEKNALVVDYKSSKGIYDAIIRILTDKDLTEKLVENGRKDVERFNLSAYIHRLENLYSA